jgi:predicted transcriptional regulator
MKKSKLDIPHIREKVVKELAVGKSQNVIAKDVGLNQSSVSRFANRDDIRALIEQEQAKLLDCVPDAVQNVKDLVREMRDIPKKDTKRRELSYKASKDVLKSVGLLPTPIQSQTFVNLYQDNKTVISPFIQELLNAKFDEITADAST